MSLSSLWTKPQRVIASVAIFVRLPEITTTSYLESEVLIGCKSQSLSSRIAGIVLNDWAEYTVHTRVKSIDMAGGKCSNFIVHEHLYTSSFTQ